jgi:hypothetical protein
VPLTYRIDRERRRAVGSASGTVSAQEFLAQQAAMALDPDFEPDFDQLYDLRKMKNFGGSANNVSALAVASPFATGSRRALVVSSDVIFGLARMFQTLSDESGDEIQIFRDMDAAEAWLEEGQ